MSTKLHELLEFKEVGICISTPEHNVLYQNDISKTVCGDHKNKHCELCQNITFKNKINGHFLGETSIHKEKKTLANSLCDIYKIKEKNNQELTILYPLKKSVEAYTSMFDEAKLTKTEKKIATLVVKKQSNATIQNELFITKATLKTHLNHIYKKLPLLKSIRSPEQNKSAT